MEFEEIKSRFVPFLEEEKSCEGKENGILRD